MSNENNKRKFSSDDDDNNDRITNWSPRIYLKKVKVVPNNNVQSKRDSSIFRREFEG